MKAIIISGGTPPSKELLKKEIIDEHVIICADSGANCLFNFGIIPDFLFGDFDSIDKNILEYFMKTECVIDRFPKEKDFSDTELALQKAFDIGAEEIVFLGCTGGRIDHTLSNLGLLLSCLNQGISAFIKDDKNTVTIANSNIAINGERGHFFSIIPYNGEVKNLSIHGAKYKLDNYMLRLGDTRTVSNEFEGREVNISFDNGIVLVVYSKD